MSSSYSHKLKHLGLMVLLSLSGTLPLTALAETGSRPLAAEATRLQQSPDQVRNEINRITAEIRTKQSRWSAKETPLTKLTLEGKRKWLGLLPPPADVTPYINQAMVAPNAGEATLPSRFDWRSYNGHNYVSPIKNQGGCGSCWAFATVAALESKAMITLNLPDNNLDLSEQIVLSCSKADSCDGGWPDQASNFLKSTGSAAETYYPYTERNGNCTTAATGWQNNSYKINNWQYVSRNASPSVSTLKNALYTQGPLSTTLMVYEDFYSYADGVYSYTTGNYVGPHAIVIVGWDDTLGAFFIKNSWGTGWGKGGFGAISYSELSSVVQFAKQQTLAFGDAIAPNFHCRYSLSKATDTVPAFGGSGSVSLSAEGCRWSASSQADWITITSATEGTGNSTVSYAATPNPSNTARTGALTIANQTYTITQAGNTNAVPICSLVAIPDRVALGESAMLTATCSPTATSYQWTHANLDTKTSRGNVTPTTTTTYSVVGSNQAGSGNTATATVTVVQGRPVTPTSLLAPTGTINTLTPSYSWGAVSGATDYYLYIKTSASGNVLFNQAYTATELGCANGRGTCTATPSTLTLVGGTTYSWYILARNNAGDSPWSAPKSFTVRP